MVVDVVFSDVVIDVAVVGVRALEVDGCWFVVTPGWLREIDRASSV